MSGHTNADVDWDRWPVGDYLAENYRQLHPADAAVIDHHSAFYRGHPDGSLGSGLEFGAGPNLYPLMLAAAACRSVHALDHSAANVAYLDSQLRARPDPSWQAFYDRCRSKNPALPRSLTHALGRVTVGHGDGRSVPAGSYDTASMNFVAESVTEHIGEFAEFCLAFVRSVRHGGHLVASFMENMGRYRLGDGSRWPGYPVGPEQVDAVFAPETTALRITRIDADPTLPAYGYTGMVLLTAVRR